MKGQTNKPLLAAKLQRHLRNHMTDAEQRLWRALRGKQLMQFKFRRQHPFGGYILDFVCLEAMLVIEVDGGQHADQTCADSERTAFLEQSGFRVLRFWNNEVLNETDAVLSVVWRSLEERRQRWTPSPPCSSP